MRLSDFIHGTIGSHLTVRRTRLERTLPCDLRQIDARLRRYYLGRYASVRCGHQDLRHARALRHERPGADPLHDP